MRNLTQLIIAFLLVSCSYADKFNADFDKHVSSANLILDDGDFLHPTKAYLRNNRLIGLSFEGNGEFGKYVGLYFIDDSLSIEKIIIRKDFYNHYNGAFDSLYVINPKTKEILAYTSFGKGKEIKNEDLILNELIDVEEYIEKIQSWKISE